MSQNLNKKKFCQLCYEESLSVKSQSSTCKQFIRRSLSQKTWKAAVPVELRSDSCPKTRKFLMSNCQTYRIFPSHLHFVILCVLCWCAACPHVYSMCVCIYLCELCGVLVHRCTVCAPAHVCTVCPSAQMSVLFVCSLIFYKLTFVLMCACLYAYHACLAIWTQGMCFLNILLEY